MATEAAEGEGVVVEITAKNYDTVMHEGPWMVVVSATWCPHCKQLEPTWTRLAERLEGKVRVGKINGPEQDILTRRLHVAGYPTIFHVDKQGKIRDYGERSRELEKVCLRSQPTHSPARPPRPATATSYRVAPHRHPFPPSLEALHSPEQTLTRLSLLPSHTLDTFLPCERQLYQFAISGHKSVEPLPWYHTPHSLFGQMVKAILEYVSHPLTHPRASSTIPHAHREHAVRPPMSNFFPFFFSSMFCWHSCLVRRLPQDLQELYEFLSTDLGLSDVLIIFSGLVLPLVGGVFVIGLMDLIFVQMHCRSSSSAHAAATNDSNNSNNQQQQQQQQQANGRPHAD